MGSSDLLPRASPLPRGQSCRHFREGNRIAAAGKAIASRALAAVGGERRWGGVQFLSDAASSTSWCTSESDSSYSIAKPEELCRMTRPTNSCPPPSPCPG